MRTIRVPARAFAIIAISGSLVSLSQASASPADARISSVQSMQLSIESLTALWIVQHDGVTPDFGKYPNWEQYVGTTFVTGQPASNGTLGPYLHVPPVNPLNGRTDVVQVNEPVAPGYRPAGAVGWVYSSSSRTVLATDPSALVCADPTQYRPRVPTDWEKLKSHYAAHNPIVGTARLVLYRSDEDPQWFLLIPVTGIVAVLSVAWLVWRRLRTASRRRREKV